MPLARLQGKVDAKATLDPSVPADEFGFTSGALAMLTQLLVVECALTFEVRHNVSLPILSFCHSYKVTAWLQLES